MTGFICKPLLYCYILLSAYFHLASHAELVSAPHLLSKRHAGRLIDCYLSAGYLSPDYLSVSCRNKFGMTAGLRFHPIHVSTSNIEFNKQDNKFEVICSVFTDDFEAALAKQYNAKTDLNKADMHKAMDILVQRYLAANLFIQADNKPVRLNYLGYEINHEYAEVYLESDQLQPVKKVDAEVSLLYNLFDDQMQIIHIIVNGTRKSERVNYPDKKVEQVF